MEHLTDQDIEDLAWLRENMRAKGNQHFTDLLMKVVLLAKEAQETNPASCYYRMGS